MKRSIIAKAVQLLLFFPLAACLVTSSLLAASAHPTLLKAKQEAEAKGYIFVSNHDEIVAAAKREGKLRVLGSMTAGTYKVMMSEFRKRYPFIDVSVEDLRGTDAHQRTLLELKTGRATDWDLCYVAPDFYNDYVPYIKNLTSWAWPHRKYWRFHPP